MKQENQNKQKYLNPYNSVFYKIDQLSVCSSRLAKNFFEIRNVDITPEEFKALNFILIYPEICQRDLAKFMLRDRVRTGRILQSLEEKGFIKRSNDTKNNRLVRKLKVTKAGQDLFDKQYEILMGCHKKLLEKFSQEQMENLYSALEKLETAMLELVEFNI